MAESIYILPHSKQLKWLLHFLASQNAKNYIVYFLYRIGPKSWSYLVEGDGQLDRPNSQTRMEWCHAWAAYFWSVSYKNTACYLGQFSFYLLLLKSSMPRLIIKSKLIVTCIWKEFADWSVSGACQTGDDNAAMILPK